MKDIDRIEGTPRYFTRRVFYKNEFSYNNRLFLLDMESLKVIRVETDLIMYYKVINGLNDLNPYDFFSVFAPNLSLSTRGHSFKLVKQSNTTKAELHHTQLTEN